MEFLRDTQIDFMKYRRGFVVASVILVLISVLAVFVHGKLNMGIDFAGGSQLTLRFQEHPEIDELRGLLESAGFQDALIQRFGEETVNEVMIKTPLAAEEEQAEAPAPAATGEETEAEDSEERRQAQVLAALDGRFNSGVIFDLNRSGSDALAAELVKLDPEGVVAEGGDTATDYYATTAAAVIAARDEDGIFTSWDEVASAEGVSATVLDALEKNTSLGGFALLAAESVGPQIGGELRTKGILAVVLSLVGMLLYMWFRFELRFGVGALVAVFHDVLVVLGLYALMDFEFNLTTIAAFLTLVGYSVNDTVVIFDRVRENMRRARREPLTDTLNKSINQTLSRTILTSGTTLLAVGALFVLGGDVLRGFSFVLSVGVIVGTYSSVYVASPFAVLWEYLFGSEAKSRREAKAA